MANDRGDATAPRPRRRRTDIDPNAPTPKVANERRRSKRSAAPPSDPVAEPLEAASPELPPVPAESPTTVFHLPGGVSSAGSARGATPVSTAGASAADAPRRAGRSTRDDATSPTVDGAEGRTTWLPRPDDRSLDPAVCPFLRAAVDGDLSAPIEAPDPANRCAALREVVPQSRRQQELVCLTSGHVNCPRYLRGSAVTPEAARPVVRPRSSLSPAVIASLLVVIIAFSASVAFVVGRGGIALQAVVPDASASPSSVAAASPSIAPTASGSTQPSATPTPTVSPTAEPTPTPTPTPKPTPSPTATATATPRPTSNRYELLTACPNTPRCWIYRVRSGDNLFSIANYFGVSLDSIYDRNPWLRNTGLRQGQELRLPPPTR